MTRISILLGLPLIAACTPLALEVQNLAPSSWAIIALDGKPPTSADARLTVSGDRFTASAGCNTIAGDWVMHGNRLGGRSGPLAGTIVSTRMYCEDLMAEEQALVALLGGSPLVTHSAGSLTLQSDDHSAELTRLP